MAEEKVSEEKDVKKIVTAAISEVSGIPVDQIGEWMSLGDFLDSLELVEMLLLLEDDHGIHIEETEVSDMMDVRVFVTVVEKKMGVHPGHA